MTITDDPICVYTALFGRYEVLNPQPIARGSNDRWVCFTDDPELRSDDWNVVVVDPEFPLDPHRSSRHVKMLGHPETSDFETTLWIDNSVVLAGDPRSMAAEWLDDAEIAFASHSYRSTLLDEFLVVLDDELDDPSRVIEQLEHYARTRPHVLDQRPFWGGIIARRRSLTVHSAMQVWWDHLLRYSRRDQLSLLYALDSRAISPRRIDIDNYESRWHRWPVIPERNGRMRARSVDAALRRPLANTLRLERAMEEMRGELNDAVSDATAARAAFAASERRRGESESRLHHVSEVELPTLAAELDRVRQELATTRTNLEQATGDLARVEKVNSDLYAVHEELGRRLAAAQGEVDAIHGSRSWRLGRSMTRAGRVLLDPLHRGGSPA